MQNPSIFSISICVLKPLVVEMVFQTRILDFLHSIGRMLFGHKGIYDYRSIKQKNWEAETWDNGKTQNEVWT